MSNTDAIIAADPWLAYNKARRDLIIHFRNINMSDDDIMRAINIKSSKHIERILNSVPATESIPTPSEFAGL